MGRVSINDKVTFGFKNVNGKAFKLKIERSPRGTFINRLTLPLIRQRIVTVMNKYGRQAEKLAKTPGWSPYLNSHLVRSIKWQSAKRKGFTGLIRGDLTVAVPYGRRWELDLTHPRRLYLQRALEAVQPLFAAELQNKRVMEEILIGKRKLIGGKNPFSFTG